MDKTTTYFHTHPMADTGRCFYTVRKFGFLFISTNKYLVSVVSGAYQCGLSTDQTIQLLKEISELINYVSI